jgi:LCP family protein required for cell wall assembly
MEKGEVLMAPSPVPSGYDGDQPGHVVYKRLGGWKLLTLTAASLVTVLVVSLGVVAGITLINLTSAIQTIALPGKEQPVVASIGELEGGFNVLIIGSDTRVGQGDQFGDVDSELNDVNILVHVSENHEHATVISLPRDMLIDVPSCLQEDGTLSSPRTMTALNATWGIGGMPCVVAAVEETTGLEIGYAGVMTFTGVAQLSTAVGGVEVCVTEPVFDPWSGLDLPEAGWHEIEGGQALAFLRTRKSVGDGSDLARISTQQIYMAALVRTLRSDGVLRDLRKLYGIAEVATNTMVLSSSLGSLDVMVSMALALRNIPPEKIVFIQFPVLDAPEGFSGKVIPDSRLATIVLDKIRADLPFTLQEGSDGRGSTVVEPPPSQDSVAQPDPEPAPESAAPGETPGETPGGTPGEGPGVDLPNGEEAPSEPSDPGTDEVEQVTESEVISGLVGQTASDVTCAVVR